MIQRLRQLLVVGVIVLAGCTDGGDGGADTTPTAETTGESLPAETTIDTGPGFTIPPPPQPAEQWAVDTSVCADPVSVDSRISGVLTIGTTAPQTAGLATAIYAPVLEGFRAAIDDANERGVLDDVQLQVVVADDEGRPELTPVAVGGLLEAGAQVISAVPGSANNLAVRDSLNANCVPQLMSLASSPRLGEVRSHPWTLGGLVTDTVETTVYANTILRSLGQDATVAVVVTDNDDGSSFAAAFAAAANDAQLSIVDQQLVVANVVDAPVAQIGSIAAKTPQVVVAALAGATCATFLTELGRVRDATPGWTPDVYVASTCADASLLRLAGPAGDGVMSSSSLIDDDTSFVERMTARGVTSDFGRAAEGWTAGEVTVAILAAAQDSPNGLTRASIIDAARNLSFTPSLARPGVEYTTNGDADAYPVESLQVVRYVAGEQRFDDVGLLVAQFES